MYQVIVQRDRMSQRGQDCAELDEKGGDYVPNIEIEISDRGLFLFRFSGHQHIGVI
jgi:hypothetical protein